MLNIKLCLRKAKLKDKRDCLEGDGDGWGMWEGWRCREWSRLKKTCLFWMSSFS